MTFVRAANEPDPTIAANQQIAETASMLNTNSNHPADVAIRKEQGEQIDTRQERASLDVAQVQAVDDQNTFKLLQHAQELEMAMTSTGKPLTPWTAPVNLLRDYVETLQALDADAKRRGLSGFDAERMQYQVPQPDNQQPPFTYKDNGNGTVTVNLKHGETFTGSYEQVIKNLAKSKQHTTEWAQGFRNQLTQQQPTRPEQPTTIDVNQPVQTQPEQQYASIIDWVADGFAKKVGYSNADDMIRDQMHRGEVTQQMEDHMVVADFLKRCPDFPCTDSGAATLEAVTDRLGWDMRNLDQLEAAHQMAIKNNLYSPEDQRIVSAQRDGQPVTQQTRPAVPPPPPPVGSLVNTDPKYAVNGVDPYSIPLDELRKAALAGSADPVYTSMIPAKRGAAY
jgi:hypothetical protein